MTALAARTATPRLVYVTDTATVAEAELLGRIERIARTAPELLPAVAVQLRDLGLPTPLYVALARRLRAHSRALGYRFFVNDRVDVALLVAADGVHLGGGSMSIADARLLLGARAFVSVACHRVDEVAAAARAGADACSLSPIFESPGKGRALGPEIIAEARASLASRGLAIGIVALGGIDDATAQLALRAGADGVAAIRAEIAPKQLRTRPVG